VNSRFHFHSNNPNKSYFPPFQQQSRRTKTKQESKRQKHKLKGEIKQTNLELDGGRQEQMQSNNSQKKLVLRLWRSVMKEENKIPGQFCCTVTPTGDLGRL
jgi:hypothetical protein